MLILGLDTETDHYDPLTAKVTEIGAVLFDTVTRQPVEIESHLIREVDLQPLSEKIIKITGITDDMIAKHGKRPIDVIKRFLMLYEKADYVLAHNGNGFDRPLMRAFFGRYLTEGELKLLTPKHWIDSLTDVPYEEECKQRSMTYLQGYYKLVNPFQHRALTDILTTLTIVDQNFNWDEIVTISKSPTLTYIANVDYHNRDVAKEAGFKWDAAERKWKKSIKKYFVERDNISFSFPCSITEEA